MELKYQCFWLLLSFIHKCHFVVNFVEYCFYCLLFPQVKLIWFHLLLAFANLKFSSYRTELKTLVFKHFCVVSIAGHEPVFKDKKVLLLEAAAQRKQHQLPESFSSRVCALSGGTIRLLESMFVCHMLVSRVMSTCKAVFSYVIVERCLYKWDTYPFNGHFYRTTWGKPAPERLNQSGF